MTNVGPTAAGCQSLWRDRDFTAFWVAQTVSMFGSQVTFVALPLIAVLTLQAGVEQVGALRFAEYLPFLLFTLPFGAWVDRRRRLPLMLASYAVCGLLVALVPLFAALGLLNLPLLVIVAFAVGVGTALFEVCWLSFVPGLVGRDRLIEAMGKVQSSQSAAEIAGPGVGGLLVRILGAPYALTLDALSYLVGFLALLRIRHQEPAPARPAARHVVRELREGLRFAFGEPTIRATAIAAAVSNFFALVAETAFLVYAVRTLRFGPELLGLVLGAVGAGGLVGAAFANAVSRRWPLGRVYVAARVAGSLAALLLPLATPGPLAVTLCIGSFFLTQVALANTNVLNSSLRQALTPDRIRARMNASARTLVYGALPFGGLAGGILGDMIGPRATLWVGAIGFGLAIVPILASPIPGMRTLPAPATPLEPRPG